MPIKLPDLPYAQDGLEPIISKKTLEFHYGKHHQTYVNKLNELISGTEFETLSLEEIIMSVKDDATKKPIFNNAAQVWNHNFYWKCMQPNGGGKPSTQVLSQIEKYFRSYDEFLIQFKNAALTQFGSGWAWLVLDQSGKLAIQKTSNADLPMIDNQRALLTIDVWEHAYYLDFQNRRPDYINSFFDKLVNWGFVESQLG